MTRVSSFGHNQSMVNSLLQNQARLFEGQNQINTGKKSDEFRGYARQAETLLSARTLKTRTTGYADIAADIKRKLNTNEINLEAIRKAGDNLHQAMIETISQGQATALQESLQQALSTIVTALNTQVNGNYIFSGARTDTKPITAETVADLVAAPTVSSLFQNDSEKLSGKVGDNVDVEYGMLASDVASDIMTSLKAIADFDAGGFGPLDGTLNPTQASFLQTEMSNLVAAIDKVQSYISQNGLRQNRVDDVVDTLGASDNFLSVFISDIEDVNVAEAITRVNADQISLQASYSIVGQISKMTLLNFL